MAQYTDTTADILHKIDAGLLGSAPSTISPEIVYILIGINNFWGSGNNGSGVAGTKIGVSNSQQAMEGVKAIVEKARFFCPDSKVVLTYIAGQNLLWNDASKN